MTPVLPDTYSKEEKEEIERRHQHLLDAWQTRKEAADLDYSKEIKEYVDI